MDVLWTENISIFWMSLFPNQDVNDTKSCSIGPKVCNSPGTPRGILLTCCHCSVMGSDKIDTGHGEAAQAAWVTAPKWERLYGQLVHQLLSQGCLVYVVEDLKNSNFCSLAHSVPGTVHLWVSVFISETESNFSSFPPPPVSEEKKKNGRLNVEHMCFWGIGEMRIVLGLLSPSPWPQLRLALD